MTRLTVTDLVNLPARYQKQIEQMEDKPKKSKYGNKKVKIDGHTFDSKREAEYYQELKIMKKAGYIHGFELQPVFLLQEAFTKNGKRHQAIKYIADFKVIQEDGRVDIVDVKGHETQVFRIKRKLFEARYPDLTLKLIK